MSYTFDRDGYNTILDYYTALWVNYCPIHVAALLASDCTFIYEAIDTDSPQQTLKGRDAVMSDWYDQWFSIVEKGSTEIQFQTITRQGPRQYYVAYNIHQTHLIEGSPCRYNYYGEEYISLTEDSDAILHNHMIRVAKNLISTN